MWNPFELNGLVVYKHVIPQWFATCLARCTPFRDSNLLGPIIYVNTYVLKISVIIFRVFCFRYYLITCNFLNDGGLRTLCESLSWNFSLSPLKRVENKWQHFLVISIFYYINVTQGLHKFYKSSISYVSGPHGGGVTPVG